ncbi:MAG: shikimate dehydrogenase [Cyanobacteriota bacterium]|nr:shikimate dehydrogenase [Cyanobacteriota bacterium]
MAALQHLSISGTTQLVGVLGDPVRHSLSPAMHNAAIQALGLDWVYLALPVRSELLAAVLTGLEGLDCQGLNVTIPHKQAVARLCRTLSPLAQRLGAVNTLVPLEGGGWHGENTDVEGFLAPLRDHDWTGRRALVLGCGGSARAVVAALVELGLERITVVARRPEPLAAFTGDYLGWAPQLHALAWSPAALLPELQAASLVVNTTPVGMASASDPDAAGRCPLAPTELAALQPGCWVYDLIYVPRPSRLLQAAAARGCRTLDGLEMLVQQGAAALRLWSGRAEVPAAVMAAAAAAQLQARHRSPLA